ncbi:MAG TPA: ABC transporter permease [Bryobacteraceae bacterium]|nr:ABC transporter permease [Bryobacteraceae bacterium]
MRELLRRLRFLLGRPEYERELEEEMAHHLAMLEENGRLPAAARRQFGNLGSLREESRSMWTFAFLEQTAQDIRYALRMMAANPLFTATAALSLALGIGANTAIYSFLDAILMRSLPVANPHQLAILKWHAARSPGVIKGANGRMSRYGKTGRESPNFPFAAYQALRDNPALFSTMIGYTYVQNFNVTVGDAADSIPGGFVSGNYFSGLGVPPAAGRLLVEDDDRPGASPAVVLAYAYWQGRFNGDPSAMGKSIRINDVPFTIAGVAGPGFSGVDPQSNPSFFLPIHQLPPLSPHPGAEERSRFFDKNFYWLEMMIRLRPGVTLEQAQAALSAQFHRFAAGTAATPKEAEVLPDLSLEPGGAGLDYLRREYSKPLYVLMTMVGLILAIACANLANLLLARAATRRREMAVRLSLGAGRWRIVRQLLTESVLLAVTGGAMGLFVAFAGIRMITWLIANGRENFTLHAALNWPVLGFTFALSVASGLVFGLTPALQSTKADFTPALKEGRSQGWGRTGHGFRPRLGHVLMVGQIALSLLLVIGAGLFIRTLSNLHSIDVGFNRENILLVSINGRQAGYRDAALARFYSGLLDRFREIPGVRSATASNVPLVAQYVNNPDVIIPGRPSPQHSGTECLKVDPAFLETMEIPVVLGRGLQREDLASPAVAVVNQKFASAFFPGENPLGRQFALGSDPGDPMLAIVGVSTNAHYNSLQESGEPVVYIPYTQGVADLRGMFFELRTAGDPFAAVGAVRRMVQDASRAVPITEVTTQALRMEQTISQERTFANLGACFAVLALSIACVGLYGTMAYAVARRTGEIGIRMALGAQRRKIIAMVLREVFALTAAGLLIGYGAAHFMTYLVESFLYGIKANDPPAVWAAIGILLAAVLAAGYAPARRASRIDPAAALRNE